MARTAAPRIVEWSTPPPEATGWEAIAAELNHRPGRWAMLGEMAVSTAKNARREHLPTSKGYEHRAVPTRDNENRVQLWVRFQPLNLGKPAA